MKSFTAKDRPIVESEPSPKWVRVMWLEAAYNYMQINGYISQSTWRLLEDYANTADKPWKEPDSGIWEVRSLPLRPFQADVLGGGGPGYKNSQKAGVQKQAGTLA